MKTKKTKPSPSRDEESQPSRPKSSKKDLSKSLRIVELIRALMNARDFKIDDDTFRRIMGNPSKANYHVIVKQLTTPLGFSGPVLIREALPDNGGFYYYLSEDFEQISNVSAVTEFSLECYSRLGSVLPEQLQNRMSSISEKKQLKTKNLKRKFCNIAPIVGKPFDQKQKNIVMTIVNSVLNEKEMIVTYHTSKDEVKEFNFQAYTLCAYREDLYVLGRYLSGGEYHERMLKIRRILKAQQLDNAFKYPSERSWNPIEKFSHSSGIITQLDETCEVKVRVYGLSRNAFKDKVFFQSRFLDNHADYDEYELICTRYNEFIGQLFVYAQDIEIVDNPKVRELFKQKAHEALNRNR